jgi:hypothetical protein
MFFVYAAPTASQVALVSGAAVGAAGVTASELGALPQLAAKKAATPPATTTRTARRIENLQ